MVVGRLAFGACSRRFAVTSATAAIVFLCAMFAIVPRARAETYRLTYEAEVLNLVVLGTASFEVAVTPTRYAVRAGVETSGLARLFDQTQITAAATGVLAGPAVQWARYDISHAYSGKFRRIQMIRGADGTATEINPAYRDMGSPQASRAQQAASYDPLSALFALGVQIGAARACRGAALVFDGRQHYRLAVTPRAEGAFNGGGYRGAAVSCNFRYEPLSGFSAGARPTNVPVAEAWFGLPTQRGFAPPLQLTVQTPLGAARLDLRSYQAR